ncbi:MAG: hypothetical protein N3D11_01895 [Candidatus Sumerlaeia bacterium]|nr:hypothetical protein [Candidatus Sumerlaeia bacterium]
MAWLYQEETIEALFLALIAITPAIAAVGGVLHRLAAGRLSRRALTLWAGVALAGPANYGLWRLFNAIEDYWGLDRVKPLLINFAIFVALGVVVGLVLRILLRPE